MFHFPFDLKILRLALSLAVALIATRPCLAQFDALKQLFGGKPPAKAQPAFSGQVALSQAVAAAESGETEASLKLAADAFRDGGVTHTLDHPEAKMVAASVIRLSRAWEAQSANPAEVALLLRKIVLPDTTTPDVQPYPGLWTVWTDAYFLTRPNLSLPTPMSVGEELVRWTVRAKQTEDLRQRLKPLLTDPKSDTATKNKPNAAARLPKSFTSEMARVLAVQLAMTEHDMDVARTHLSRLNEDAQLATGPLLEYLCHAVSAGLHNPKTVPSALRLMESILDRVETVLPAESPQRQNSPWLRVQAASIYAKEGRKDDARRNALSALANPINSSRFGADYATYLDHLLRQRAIVVLFDSGHIVDGLELASKPMDPKSLRFGRDSSVNFVARAARALNQLPTSERFELLKQFAIPADSPGELRSMFDLVPIDSIPPLGSGLLSDIYSTNRELIAAAREAGQLDSLIQDIVSLKSPHPSVQSLLTLALVMRDGSSNATGSIKSRGATTSEISARLDALVEATKAGVPPWEMQVKPDPPVESYVIATEAALHPEWREQAEQLLNQLIEHAQKTQSARLRDHFRLAMMEVKRLRANSSFVDQAIGGASPKAGDNSVASVRAAWANLKPRHWDSLGFESASERALGAMPPTWFTHEGYYSHLSTGRESDLCFSIPIVGPFELSCECREGGWTEGRVGYGGISAEVFAHNNTVNIRGKGEWNSGNNPRMTNLLNTTPWNRHFIRFDGERVQYYVNGQQVFEDTPGTAAPWLTLGGTVGFTPSYRNLRIRGNPAIPREVRLLGDQRLRGWVSNSFGESRPESIRARKYIQIEIEQNGQKYMQLVEDDGTMEGQSVEMSAGETDWALLEGELRSNRRGDFWSNVVPSWLSYQRPLRNNESLHYDFYYLAGTTIAYPTVGETVYAYGENTIQQFNDSKTDNDASIEERLAMKVLDAHGLNDGWNSGTIALENNELKLTLNGDLIHSEKLSETNSRRIGFYHNAATSDLRVRNVVLTGDWPQSFDASVRSAIESPVPNTALPRMQFLAETPSLNESHIVDNAFDIYQRALQLDAAQRFEYLHRWVMPNESHETLRMAGAFTPTHPAPPILDANPIDTATAEVRQSIDSSRIQAGGNFVCPAILLVLAASELDRLQELKNQTAALDPDRSPGLAQNRAALLGMIALLDDLPTEAIERMNECFTLLVKNPQVVNHQRWGNVALTSLAIQHPATRRLAYEILDKLQWVQLPPGHSSTPEFERFVRQLHDQALYLNYGGASEEFGSQPKTSQWRTVSISRARARGTGYPITAFDTLGGELAQRGGHDFDAAYFQSPLRGNYEVRCQLAHLEHRESMLMAAGIANSLKWNHKEVKVTYPGHWTFELPLAAQIKPEVQQWIDYRIQVKDGHYSSYINGQKLYEEALAKDHDPWLAVTGWAGHSSRAVRNIVIEGTPNIPGELNLLGGTDLRGWMADYYAAEWGQKPFPWTMSDGELQSAYNADYFSTRSRLKVENIIRYHRPLIEDSEIEYEFFFEQNAKFDAPADRTGRFGGGAVPKRTIKGQTIVHPALDRMVCLLEPDGVKIHWLTDGRWDRTGLMAENVERVTTQGGSGAELPLKNGEWNSVKFAINGNTLTIQLNGKLILSREVEPTNLRHFGLFHYVNESNVRVKNVRYRGAWPRTLPSVAEQDLAAGPQQLAAVPDAELPFSVKWDFTGSKFDSREFQYHWNNDASKQIRATPAGLHFVQPAGEMKPQEVGLAPRFRISGDFIATIEYEGLKTTAAQEEWGSGLSFKALTDGWYNTGIEVRDATKSTSKSTRSIVAVYYPNSPWGFHTQAIPAFPAAGKLRLQRHGAVFYTFIAPPDSEEFRLIAQHHMGAEDVWRLTVNADASDRAAGSEFTLKSLSIRATQLTKIP